jgi:hypothetical protein
MEQKFRNCPLQSSAFCSFLASGCTSVIVLGNIAKSKRVSSSLIYGIFVYTIVLLQDYETTTKLDRKSGVANPKIPAERERDRYGEWNSQNELGDQQLNSPCLGRSVKVTPLASSRK